MQRAYARLETKTLQETPDHYIITGIASSPRTDRVGDVVEPLGAHFDALPKLFMHHDTRLPVGSISEAKPNAKGIPFTARIPKVAEAGVVKDRIDEAVHSIKYDLLSYVSIGFKPTKSEPIDPKNPYFGGEHFHEWDWLELSIVGVPANPDAVITGIKSIDDELHAARVKQTKSIDGHLRAASGTNAARPVVRLSSAPGASGNPIPKGTEMKTIAEQIASFEAKRAATVARREAVQQKALDESRTKDAAEREEFENCTAEIDSIDAELKDLRVMEAQVLKTATPVTKAVGADPGAASAARGGVTETRITHVRPNVEKGVGYIRIVKSLIESRGNPQLALMYAEAQKSWADQTPGVVEYLKTAVAGGVTTSSGWASEFVTNQNLVQEFIDILRPQTVLGKLTGLTKVPFNVRMSGIDSGSTAYWVGQGKPVPVSKLNSLEVTLGIAKAAGLVVLTKELVRSSDPNAEVVLRNEMMKTMSTFMDVQFLDPNVAVVANVSPASITNGVTAVTPTGTALTNLRTDIQTLFRQFIANNDDPTSATWIMDPTMALTFSMIQNALGQNEFPGMTINGGTFAGLPAVVSNSANITGSPDSGHMLILAKTSDILFADDGGTEIDASDQASIEMLDNPTNSAAAGTATSMVSMYQTNSVAVKAVRYVNWKKKRSGAVSFIKEAAYVAA